jgi:ribosome-associated protein
VKGFPLPKPESKRPAAKKPAAKKPAAKKAGVKQSAKMSAKASAKASVRPSTKAAAAPAKKPEVDRSAAQETLRLVLAKLDDMKADDSVTIDLAGKSSIGDFMVVTTGRSSVHVGAIADSITRALKGAGNTGLRVEGLRQGDWVLIDAGDVIVHVFRPEVREFYGLEKMWSV